MQLAFRRRYHLAPLDPRFLDMTQEEIESDYWANHYLENGIPDEIEDTSFDLSKEVENMGKDDWEDV